MQGLQGVLSGGGINRVIPRDGSIVKKGKESESVEKQFTFLLTRELLKTALKPGEDTKGSGLFPSGVQGDFVIGMIADSIAEKVADSKELSADLVPDRKNVL